MGHRVIQLIMLPLLCYEEIYSLCAYWILQSGDKLMCKWESLLCMNNETDLL